MLADDANLIRNKIGAVEADAELADHGDVTTFSGEWRALKKDVAKAVMRFPHPLPTCGHGLHESLRARLGNRA